MAPPANQPSGSRSFKHSSLPDSPSSISFQADCQTDAHRRSFLPELFPLLSPTPDSLFPPGPPAPRGHALPLASFLARYILHPPQPVSLPRTVLRPLSLPVIRELAVLEHAFVRSPFHRLFSFLAPPSSTLPFLATLALGLVPFWRLWRAQRTLLVQLLVTGAPMLRTLRALAVLHARPAPTDADAAADELTRWTMYWLLYATLATLEAIELPRAAQAHPTIYPALPRAPSLLQRLSRFAPALRRPAPTPPKLSLSTPIPASAHFFSAKSTRYVLLKLIFLRWCAANSSCGALKIWNIFLAPLTQLVPCDSSPARRVKRVVVYTEEDAGLTTTTTTTTTQTLPDQRLQPEPVRRTHSDPVHTLSIQTTIPLSPNEVESYHDQDCKLLGVELGGEKLETLGVGFKTPENAWESVSGEME